MAGSRLCDDRTVLMRSSIVAWLAVGAAVIATTAAAALGLIGEERLPERYDAKTIVIAPAGGDALRVTEIVDVDFGRAERRGYQRIIPLDLGMPTDITARSATAPDDVGVVDLGGGVRIRVGDPDQTVTGRHRYVLAYTYPDAGIATGRLSLDVIGTDEEFETERFEIVVTGLDIDDPTCATGGAGAVGGCTLARDGDVYRAVISPLEPGAGITISGEVVGRTPLLEIAEPPLPPARETSTSRGPLAIAIALVGLGVVGAIRYVFGRWGRNLVYGGGAADAAFGERLTAPPGTPASEIDRPATRLVSDADLGELSTTEFAPPEGIEPWEAQVLLGERIDDETVAAWFSGLAGHGVITLDEREKSLVIAPGPNRHTPPPGTAELLDRLFAGGEVVLHGYVPAFAEVWNSIRDAQSERIAISGWWARYAPRPVRRVVDPVRLIALGGVAVAALLIWAAFAGALSLIALAVIGSAGIVGGVAVAVWAALLRARSALGSALALRVESFRRFLAASEARHVQWAWENGLVREYSGWAVALGAATAWQRALAAAETTIPAAASSPLLMATAARYVSAAHTSPSSSSGGGGGGSVGSGGGGGSSGSW